MTPKAIPVIIVGTLLRELLRPKPKPKPKPCKDKDCKKDEKHWHHEFPKQPDLRRQFEARGIDINAPANGRVLPANVHRSIHPQWNREWSNFFAENPAATREDIFRQRDMMVRDFGIESFPRPRGRYPTK